MIKIVCENQRGEKFTFARTPRMWIESISGLGADYEIYTSKSSGQDGENYNGMAASKRNIVIVLDVPKKYMDAAKNKMYSFFQPRSAGTLYYNGIKKIQYYVESVEPSEEGRVRTLTLSLICPDPKFYALTDNLTELAVWEGCIRFPLRLPPQINAEGQPVTITPDNSINDYDKLMVTGKTVETGTGDKSPDNPYMLSGTDTLTVSDGGNNSHDYLWAQTGYSLPNGVHDTKEFVSNVEIQNVGKIVLDGTTAIFKFIPKTGTEVNTVAFKTSAISNIRAPASSYQIVDWLLSTHFPYKNKPTSVYYCSDILWGFDISFITIDKFGALVFRIPKTNLSGWSDSWTNDEKVTALKAWLSSNPVTVLYQLAEPQMITGTGQTIPVYHPTTTLSVDAGTLSLRLSGKFTVTEKINTLIGNVNNPSTVPMGLTVKFMASGTVVNPSLYDVNRHELMQINATMHAGDVITITTGDGNKRVKLISGGVTTNINNLMAYPPKWLKAYEGDNLYRYNADSGIDNLSVNIVSTEAYWGA